LKRIFTFLAVMALMAAMVAASAMPVFADPGGQRGHRTLTTTGEGDCSTAPCTSSFTTAGGPGGSSREGFNGRQSGNGTLTNNGGTFDYREVGSTQGGGKGTGGGNCTYTEDFSGSQITGGHGSRCQ
jgi:hypothetical protein